MATLAVLPITACTFRRPDARWGFAASLGTSCVGTVVALFVHRPDARSNHWSFVNNVGESLQECSEYTHAYGRFGAVPKPVLHDFKVIGMRSDGAVGVC